MTQKPTLPEEGLIGTTYWHVATFPPLLLNNAPLYRGLVPTVSLAARHEAGVVTPNDVDPMVGPFEGKSACAKLNFQTNRDGAARCTCSIRRRPPRRQREPGLVDKKLGFESAGP
jgi:hypothetical protein